MLKIHWLTQEPPPSSAQALVVGLTDVSTIASRFGNEFAVAALSARFRAASGERFGFTRTLVGGHLQHVLLIGLAAPIDSASAARTLAHDAAQAADTAGATHLVLDLRGALAPATDPPRLGALIVSGAELGLYRYERYLDAERRRPTTLAELTVLTDFSDMSQGSTRGGVAAACVARARDLVNGPAELVTPTYLAELARSLAREHAELGLACEVLERDECERRGMGLYLAVARGSVEPPKFIHLRYRPRSGQTRGRICLIGKGVTFDSGGLSLKPSDAMMGMKMDMAGAAAVIAAIEGAALLQVPWEVHAVVAATENMIGGAAYRLGDVLRASNGKTVEIDNTDAEGRLTLADALVYASGLAPDLTIDLATLTGACIVALGPHIAGVMSPDEGLTRAWLDAAERAGEHMWRLPLPSDLKELLKSPIADMRNTGERAGGSITAGLFLSEFAGGQRWLHVDIAGPAMVKKPYGVTGEGGSGFGVATILELLNSDTLPL